MMRLMLREQLPLLILYGIQTIFIPIIYWLDGYHNFWLFLMDGDEIERGSRISGNC